VSHRDTRYGGAAVTMRIIPFGFVAALVCLAITWPIMGSQAAIAVAQFTFGLTVLCFEIMRRR
jgi:hypothetical protein